MKAAMTVAITAIVTLGVAYFLFAALSGPPTRPEIAVSLEIVDGTCKVVEPVTIREYEAKQIRWRVTNNCNAARFLQLLRFRQKDLSSGSLGSEATILNGTLNRMIQAGQQQTITATITRDVSIPEVWKYDIAIGPNQQTIDFRLDPDLEIWP
jgi:hypothetical protein